MALLGLKDVSLSIGGPLLLDGANLQIEPGERIGLLGRNGAGKSTMLRLLLGELDADSGEVNRRQDLHVAGLPQDVPEDLAGSVRQVVGEALGGRDDLASWELDERLTRVLGRLDLDPDAQVATLSAGTKRRVLLARALIADPDLLVLDEPTNHLDITSIARLEEMILQRTGATVFVTHDRAFLGRLATRILDLDRGVLRGYDCGYEVYLERREHELEVEEAEQAQFDRKLAKEEAWIRRGVKARRARNMGRVRALEALREERRARREVTGQVRMKIGEADRSGRSVIKVAGLRHALGGRTLIDGLDAEIHRGDRVGIIGPNGCGKSTLVRLLLGELEPDAGDVRHGTKLEVAVFDQLHAGLDLQKTLRENVGEGGDTLMVHGSSRHVVSYLQDFLFTPEQIRSPASKLSGGERNRLQLARILARPCNLLVLDEPTNDLDLETLELLEELLVAFSGTLLLVSHDRAFLDNVVSSTIAFEGEGRVKEYAGGYSDWLRQRPQPAAPKAASKPAARAEASKPARARKLNNKERTELAELPGRIEALEQQKAGLEAEMATPEFYRRPKDEIAAAGARHEALIAALDAAFTRWAELEDAANAGG